ncbi:protein adenylyltransferase SelO [Isachenkonia alkalipeptolytica]|uniref:Protein nucleotidyltransferase YdiU n=1 Tax=Isachenkonia alkalipeptolytica TaxID=2565777 RepID=A0AA43XL22_9CLOT|nr:YdiU family protein [Isachenkonia alkalipeptolytica]NBG88597.1 YdiU family protein [Isachenkonia alkalipeptolytica]
MDEDRKNNKNNSNNKSNNKNKENNPRLPLEGWNLEAGYQQLPGKLFSKADPVPVKDPKVLVYNEALGRELGLRLEQEEGVPGGLIFSGNALPQGSAPIAQAYAGHQFGHFTMLGDGRAHLLGEQLTPQGGRYDIQLKGSGPTPYSRRGDGRAALGPMLREYIISEAMHALGIPSTRALAVVATGEDVQREERLPGGILTRVAASHIRVGTFEYLQRFGNLQELKALADYTIQRHFPEILEKSDGEEKYVKLFEAVQDKQAALIAKWQLVGFIHGVMNTDNMALSGETIDYGPCAFMDTYDPGTVFSSIDRGGRYAYKNQPSIGQWNLARFAETLLPLVHQDPAQGAKIMEEKLQGFSRAYEAYRLKGMGEKLGIFQAAKEDQVLIQRLLQLMAEKEEDFTNTFVALTYGGEEHLKMAETPRFKDWFSRWKERLEKQKKTEGEAKALMKTANPAVIPRNHQVERALKAAVEKEDFTVMEKLMTVLQNPYENSKEKKPYQEPPDPSAKPYVTYCGT